MTILMKSAMAIAIAIGAMGCATEASPESETPAHAGGKTDGTFDERPTSFYVRNDLDEPVRVILGGDDVYDAWLSGSYASGIDVDAYGASEIASFGEDVTAFVALRADGSPLDPDSLRGSVYVDDTGTLVLELVVGTPYQDAVAELSDYASEGTGEYVWIEDPPEPTDMYAVADQIGPHYSGEAVGYSTSTTTAWGWSTDENKRSLLKYEAQQDAWNQYRMTIEYMDRLAGCRSRGGSNLYIGETDCTYLPNGAGAVYGGTKCRASCSWTYRCLRIGA